MPLVIFVVCLPVIYLALVFWPVVLGVFAWSAATHGSTFGILVVIAIGLAVVNRALRLVVRAAPK